MVQSTKIDSIIGCKKYHSRRLEYGKRAWLAQGENIDVIYWDEGNGWCSVLQVLPKNGIYGKEFQKKSLNLFKKILDYKPEA